MNRTLLDERLRGKGRMILYIAPEEIPRDLDVFMAFCNTPVPSAEGPGARTGPARGARRRAPAGLGAPVGQFETE
jgi:hypothetical protein